MSNYFKIKTRVHEIVLKHGVSDSRGREVGHSVYVLAYDPVAHIAWQEERNAFHVKHATEQIAKGINVDRNKHSVEFYSADVPKTYGANVKFFVLAQITRNGEHYGAGQDDKILKAQTLEEAIAEAKAIAERLQRGALKNKNYNKITKE